MESAILEAIKRSPIGNLKYDLQPLDILDSVTRSMSSISVSENDDASRRLTTSTLISSLPGTGIFKVISPQNPFAKPKQRPMHTSMTVEDVRKFHERRLKESEREFQTDCVQQQKEAQRDLRFLEEKYEEKRRKHQQTKPSNTRTFRNRKTMEPKTKPWKKPKVRPIEPAVHDKGNSTADEPSLLTTTETIPQPKLKGNLKDSSQRRRARVIQPADEEVPQLVLCPDCVEEDGTVSHDRESCLSKMTDSDVNNGKTIYQHDTLVAYNPAEFLDHVSVPKSSFFPTGYKAKAIVAPSTPMAIETPVQKPAIVTQSQKKPASQAIMAMVESLLASCRTLREKLDAHLPGGTLQLNEGAIYKDILSKFEARLHSDDGNLDGKAIKEIMDGIQQLQAQILKRLANGSKSRTSSRAVSSPSPSPLSASPSQTPEPIPMVVEEKPDAVEQIEAVAPTAPTADTFVNGSDRPAGSRSPFVVHFDDCLEFAHSFEASFKDFVSPTAAKADTYRRIVLKRTIKEKISVMTKRMATMAEMSETVDFLHRLMTGLLVLDYSDQPMKLKDHPTAMRFAMAFIIDTYLALATQDLSSVYVIATVLSSLMRAGAGGDDFRRLCIAKLLTASTFLNLNREKCIAEASEKAVIGADAQNTWMKREKCLVRLFITLQCTGSTQQPDRPIAEGPSTLWLLCSNLLSPPTVPIATANIFVELIHNASWLMNKIYGRQFDKVIIAARCELVERLHRDLMDNPDLKRIGSGAMVAVFEETLAKFDWPKPQDMH